MPVALALVASLIWGSADFVGANLSKELAPSTVMLWSTLIALPGLAVVAVVSGDLVLDAATTGWGLFAGVTGAVGLTALYQALSTGVMGVVAPISSTSVLVPVVVGVATGDHLSVVQVVGIVAAVAGIVLAGGPDLREFRTGGHLPILWALVAALFMGSSLVGLAYGSETSSVSTLLCQRIVYVAVLVAIVLVARAPRTPRSRRLVPLGAVGAGDVTANGLFAVASRSGPLAVVSVLASLYPVTTVLLARRIHHERLERQQVIGVVCAFTGVAAVVAG